MCPESTERIAVVNGDRRSLPVEGKLLIEWLRDDLGLTGPKHACGRGHCGGCSVLVDGSLTLACSTLALLHEGKSITTAEGLADDVRDQTLLTNFVEHGAVQCGFCTAGMVTAAKAFLEGIRGTSAAVTEDDVRSAISGNICRCTGYAQIVSAILATARGAGCES